MTERGRRALDRSATSLAIGPSSLEWTDGGELVIVIDEWAVPVPRRLRGRIRVIPGASFDAVHDLDREGRHRWQPVAPKACVEVDFESPAVAWSGSAYVDRNEGDGPVADAFRFWTWSRQARPDRTTIHYDLEPRNGTARSLAFDYLDDRRIVPVTPPPSRALGRTLWRVGRSVRSDAAVPAGAVATLEDTPFYTRSRARVTVGGATSDAICESVDLERFRSGWVQALLPFRMPRRR